MIAVYRFKIFDQSTGDWVVQLCKSTADRIAALGGRAIDGTAEHVDPDLIDGEGRYISPGASMMSAVGFVPID